MDGPTKDIFGRLLAWMHLILERIWTEAALPDLMGLREPSSRNGQNRR